MCGSSARKNGLTDRISTRLAKSGWIVRVASEPVPPEPTLDDCRRAMAAVGNADVVVGVGGGSALDVAKAAALAPFGIDPSRFMNGEVAVPHQGGLPIVAIPTTAGTGSEATWVGVYTDDSGERKASFRGSAMMPSRVFLDPLATQSCPASVTAHSGLDALVQAMESMVATGANPVSFALAESAAMRIARALPAAWNDGDNIDARAEMLIGSCMAGIALNSSRLGLVHGLAHPIGARTKSAHGMLCGMLFPAVLRFNLPQVAQQYRGLASQVCPSGSPDELPDWITSLLGRFDVPVRLRDLGLPESSLAAIAAESLTSGSTLANPRPVDADCALGVLHDCW